ncbi:MAG: anti-sigma factor [Acidobacteriota bacterium]|nr:anti-sigma factor [Acidobacteriota bacterium]
MTHDDVRDLAPEYVLGILDPDARAVVARHLEACADCRTYVSEEAAVLDAIGRGVPQSAPPPALRARVLAAARADATSGASETRPRAIAASSRVPWLLAAAALLLALVAGWQVFAARGERARLEQELARQQRTDAVIASSDLVRFELSGTSDNARGRAFWSHRNGLVFAAEGLAPLPAGRTYQLWVISRGAPVSAGVFDVTPGGHARIVMSTPETLTQVEAVAVTVEPAGGLAAPSTTPILAGPASTSE